jgi:PAS domain S-box-containing protein
VTKRRNYFKATLGVLFSVLTIATIVLGVILYQSNRAANETDRLVAYSHDVINEAHQTAIAIRAAQQESNILFFNGDTTLKSSYIDARTRMLSGAERLERLTRDNAVQQGTVSRLKHAMLALVRYADLPLSHPEPFSQQSVVTRAERNAQHRTDVQAILDEFTREEKLILERHQRSHEQSVKRLNSLFALLISSLLAIIVATFLTIRYNFNMRIETENKLTKAKELFSSLFHESPVGLAIQRLEDCRFIDCNPVYAGMLKYSRTELIGRTPAELGIMQDSLEEGEYEIQVFPKEGPPIWALISVQAIHLQDQDCLLSAVIDVSSRREAEETTQRALERERELNKMKSNFVTLASHEFRTPLTTILSSAFLLENYITGEQKAGATKHVGRIKSSVNTLTTILDEFLSLSKIEEGKMMPKIEPVNIPELISSVCSSLGGFVKRGQAIQCMHEGEQLTSTDRAILTNILINLLSNSIKYSPEDSRIVIRSAVNGQLSISVRDAGIGIPPEDQDRLFNRFYRASNAGNTQGTGLGLHLTRHYVELLRGKISFTSKVGEGTEFRVELGK